MNFFDNSIGQAVMDGTYKGMVNGMNYFEEAMTTMSSDINIEIATTPFETVYTEDRIRVNYYKPPAARKKGAVKTPVLIVYALINRETMLDIQPDKSVIRNFLDQGIDLYVLEWGYPSRKDRFLTLDDHINGYINNVVDFILSSNKITCLNLMGICMGGTMCAIYSSFYPEKVKNLITTVTPTSFDHDQGLLHLWMKNTDVDMLVDTWGNMPGDMMNMGFLMLNPAKLMIGKYNDFLGHLDDRIFVENFIRMEKWIFDSPDVPGETFRQFVTDCYRNDLFIKGEMEVGGKRVDLQKIAMPLLNIYARYDHLVPPASCDQFTRACGSSDVEDVCLDTGHIGIYVSSKCQQQFVPQISDWLKQRDDAKAKPVVAGKKASAKSQVQAPGSC